MNIVIQALLDAGLLFLCGEMIFSQNKGIKAKDLILLPFQFLLCIVSRMSFSVGSASELIFEKQGFEIAPANNLFLLIFFILLVMLINSVYYKPQNNDFVISGSMAVISIYLGVKVCSVLFLSVCGATGRVLVFGSRMMALMPAVFCVLSSVPKYLREVIRNGGFAAKLVTINVTVVLVTVLTFFRFESTAIIEHTWLCAGILAVLLAVDAVLLAASWRKMQERKNIRMMEQYIPIVEELVSQVRSRQHEFNNRIFAIETAVACANSLEEAKAAVAELKEGVLIDQSSRELLVCDSKVIAGLLYEKSKQAEMAGIKVEIELQGLFRKSVASETDWIEILGIYVDNALEASKAGDTVFIQCYQKDRFLELTVKNPADPLSNTEFMALFHRGYTTKTDKAAHGFGLYNISRIAERRHGKIITRNETIHERNYVVFGVILP
ncbi:GHKL domain-containing protein [Blautia pseudococcoides]|uniref:sensor histidine kinase n=1 Tax=Blautia pseudococcoides TaxID=1796616 RepID=UPI00148B083B|nr:GHKL domain-containing protein [Blautia pseudococcoides]QJU13885.1 GHKL domain-containing protein [Blautia pseudococcoides]